MDQKIHFIMTGGTIDGFYDAVGQTARPGKVSVIPEYFDDVIKPYAYTSFETLCMKDSKEITDDDRVQMATRIQNADTSKIIITHGTDTMEKTAGFLKNALGPDTGKTVILTGSMVPLGFSKSDSGFNLGFAFAEIRRLTPGVYICMHAHIFEAGNVTKNFEQARFEEAM